MLGMANLLAHLLDFVKLAMEHKIPLVFGESAGGHIALYWSREVAVSMAVQYAVMRRNLKPTATPRQAAVR
jgi:hypothetical protein